MNHSHQLHAIRESDVENDMGLGDETAYPLLLNFRALASHQRLLRDVGDHVIQPPQVFIRTYFAGVVGNVSPNAQQILPSSRPANDARHESGAPLIACACFGDDGFHVEGFGGTAVEAFADRGAQCSEF